MVARDGGKAEFLYLRPYHRKSKVEKGSCQFMREVLQSMEMGTCVKREGENPLVVGKHMTVA